ncbi:hypothetical protein [Streptomyces cyanogenus]|uniref:hypothetical protein n=1 Tax=Streptomyces cyanogenus TaxID=80860 RepID=UPI001AA10AB0|nr:hypothetical protein [Streptomyces cyanogenus]
MKSRKPVCPRSPGRSDLLDDAAAQPAAALLSPHGGPAAPQSGRRLVRAALVGTRDGQGAWGRVGGDRSVRPWRFLAR